MNNCNDYKIMKKKFSCRPAILVQPTRPTNRQNPDQKLYFLKGINPFPLNEKFEKNYTFSECSTKVLFRYNNPTVAGILPEP